MKPTGEAIDYDNRLTRALYIAMQASGMKGPNYGAAFATISDADKEEALPLLRRFYPLGYNIAAMPGTALFHVCEENRKDLVIAKNPPSPCALHVKVVGLTHAMG